MHTADVLIIGAGVIGASIAYNLAVLDPALKIVVVEKEKLPGMGATGSCTGGIRHQFTSKINIELTKMSMPVFKRFASEMDYPIYFRQRGYLFVTGDKKKFQQMKKAVSLMLEAGVPARVLTPQEISEMKIPLEAGDLIGGTFCSLDGYADPYGVTEGYLKKAKLLGVTLLTGESVTGIMVKDSAVRGAVTSKRKIYAGTVINAGGPFAAHIAKMAGVDIPARPFRRQVYVCNPVEGFTEKSPLVIDIDTGFYVHTEKNGILILGGTDRDSYPGFDTSVDWSLLGDFAYTASKRVPCLENAEITKAYVGIRSITPDFNAIVGETEEVKRFYCACGFSGHGFMHAPAVGIILAKLVVDGSYHDLDISSLAPGRFRGNDKPEAMTF